MSTVTPEGDFYRAQNLLFRPLDVFYPTAKRFLAEYPLSYALTQGDILKPEYRRARAVPASDLPKGAHENTWVSLKEEDDILSYGRIVSGYLKSRLEKYHREGFSNPLPYEFERMWKECGIDQAKIPTIAFVDAILKSSIDLPLKDQKGEYVDLDIFQKAPNRREATYSLFDYGRDEKTYDYSKSVNYIRHICINRGITSVEGLLDFYLDRLTAVSFIAYQYPQDPSNQSMLHFFASIAGVLHHFDIGLIDDGIIQKWHTEDPDKAVLATIQARRETIGVIPRVMDVSTFVVAPIKPSVVKEGVAKPVIREFKSMLQAIEYVEKEFEQGRGVELVAGEDMFADLMIERFSDIARGMNMEARIENRPVLTIQKGKATVRMKIFVQTAQVTKEIFRNKITFTLPVNSPFQIDLELRDTQNNQDVRISDVSIDPKVYAGYSVAQKLREKMAEYQAQGKDNIAWALTDQMGKELGKAFQIQNLSCALEDRGLRISATGKKGYLN